MIIGFVGMMGSGKTLSLTRRVYNLHKKGYKVYSNMHFEFDYEPLTLELLLAYTNDPELFKDCVIVLDEIHIFIDARRSVSKKNVLISYFLTQTRKKNVKLFWTSQQERQADIRLRQNTDVMVYCSNFEYDEEVFFINRNVLMDGREFKEWFRGEEYFGLYDTNQTISL